jgi:hypothetical protein
MIVLHCASLTTAVISRIADKQTRIIFKWILACFRSGANWVRAWFTCATQPISDRGDVRYDFGIAARDVVCKVCDSL